MVDDSGSREPSIKIKVSKPVTDDPDFGERVMKTKASKACG